MNLHNRIQLLAIAGGLVTMSAGCGHAAISPQLSGARALMLEARAGAAQRLEPDELLLAQRTLTIAERQQDGSPAEIHYAYVAERQTRVAMSDARRTLLEQGMELDQSEYQRELERIARERGTALEDARDALSDRQRVVQDQRRVLAEQEVTLAAEQQARLDAEQAVRVAQANAAAALERLRAFSVIRVEATETVITLSGEVLFVTDGSTLRPEARVRLGAVAEAMIASPQQVALVAGYTDSRGSDSHNQQLSQARADTVRDFLLGAGVPTGRLRSEGRGEASPIASNHTADGRANNRRVEIILRPNPATALTTVAVVVPH